MVLFVVDVASWWLFVIVFVVSVMIIIIGRRQEPSSESPLKHGIEQEIDTEKQGWIDASQFRLFTKIGMHNGQ